MGKRRATEGAGSRFSWAESGEGNSNRVVSLVHKVYKG